MFYLLVELNGFRQLKRLDPATVLDIEHRVSIMLAESGASCVVADSGQYYYRFDSVRAGEHEHILDSAVRVREFLSQRQNALAGFALYLSADQESGDEAAVRALRAMALRTAIEEHLIVSESAAIAVEPYASLEKRGAHYIVGEKHARPSVSSISYPEFVRREVVVGSVLDACDEFLINSTGGAVLIHGPADIGKGATARSAADAVLGEDTGGWPFEIGPMGDAPYAPLVAYFNNGMFEELERAMTDAESKTFRRHRPAIDELRVSVQPDKVTDTVDADIAISYRCLLDAYRRIMTERVLPSFLLCYSVDEYDTSSLAVLQASLPAAVAQGTIVLMTSEKPFLPMTLRDVPHKKVEVGKPSPDEWREIAQRVTGPAIGFAALLSSIRGGHGVYHTLVAEKAFPRSELQNRLPPSTRLLSALDDEYVESTLAAALTDGALSIDMLSDFMSELGVPRVRTPEVVNDLQRLGFVRHTVLLSPAVPGLVDAISAAFPATARKVISALSHYLLSRADTNVLTPATYSFFLNTLEGSSAVDIIELYLGRLIERRRFREAKEILYGTPPTFPGASQPHIQRALHVVLYVSRLRLCLMSGDQANADRVFPDWRNLTVGSPTTRIHGTYLLTKAQYLNAKLAKDDASTLVKKAILAFQEADDARGVARANCEFGLIQLRRGSISSARDYFTIASRTAAQLGDRRSALHAGIMELGTDISLGNLSQARDRAESLGRLAAALRLRHEELYFDFICGRTEFELGRYDKAEETFSSCLCRAHGIPSEEPKQLMRRWLARSVSYRGAPRRGIEILEEARDAHETILVRVEALLLLEQYGDAAKEAKRRPSHDGAYFRPSSTPTWSSGFAGIEDRSMEPPDSVISHLLTAYGAYGQARHGDGESVIESLHALTRAGGSALRDPYAAVYLLLYSELLPESGREDLEDMVTILGKAVKHLQERTSRIDNYGDKTSYLRKNFWNAMLMTKAKQYNLV